MIESPIDVSTESGIVRGVRRKGLRWWRGIPYAAPPVGELRLVRPQPPLSWPGVRSCVQFGPSAPQRLGRDTDEDCLTLNIVAPEASNDPRPVMVFIHGGAYVSGGSSSALYGGDHLVRRGDIVYVSINYRLGALGYLDFSEFGTTQRPFDTNIGLRDQVAALEWVQRNVAEFGGDPSNVTIFGESSGGNAVTTLMCTPAARGLFARGIAESPPAASVYSQKRAREWAAEFLTILGAGSSDAAQVLTTATPKALVDATHTLTQRFADEQPGTRATAPVVDGDFLPAYPLDAFADGTAHPVPLIVGTNSHEGRFFPLFLNIIPTNPARIEKMFAETEPRVQARALAAYPGFPGRLACADLGGDIVFWEPSVLCAEGHSRVAPTYSYRYDFAPRLFSATGLKATHGTELIAVFGIGDGRAGQVATLLGGRNGLRAVTDTVQSHWLHFARYGKPESDWRTYSPEQRETLIIDDPPRMESDPRGDVRQAWLGYKHRR